MLDVIRLGRDHFRFWWISLLMGILSIVAGICCFATPAGSLAVLTAFFIALLIVGGIGNIAFAAINCRNTSFWGWSLARGIIELLFGIWLLLIPLPVVTAILVYLIGLWMLFHSILGICESSAFSALPVKGWGWLLACNVLSLLCAFLFLTLPAFGGAFLLVYIGLSFVLYGLFRIVLAFHLRKINRTMKQLDDEIVDAEVIDAE